MFPDVDRRIDLGASDDDQTDEELKREIENLALSSNHTSPVPQRIQPPTREREEHKVSRPLSNY